jgi:galactokinase
LDDKYHQREYPKSNPEIDASKHEWSNYFLCGYRGVLEAFKRDDVVGFSALVHGTVPIVCTFLPSV